MVTYAYYAMPLTKRTIYSAPSYGHADLHEDSASKAVLQDVNMSHLLGAIHQVSFLSSYALEVFDGLVALADNTKHRINQASQRVAELSAILPEVERRALNLSLIHI